MVPGYVWYNHILDHEDSEIMGPGCQGLKIRANPQDNAKLLLIYAQASQGSVCVFRVRFIDKIKGPIS